MIIGIGLTFLIGIIWMLVAIVYSSCTRDRSSFLLFMVSFYFLYTLIAFICPFISQIIPQGLVLMPLKIVSAKELFKLALCIVPAAVFGSAGYFTFSIAMSKGNVSVAWGIMNSSIILPFLFGLLIFKDKINATNLLGMLMIFVALFFMVKGKQNGVTDLKNNKKPEHVKEFIFLSLLSFFLVGMSQICSLLPNKFTILFPTAKEISIETMAWRVPLTALTGLIVWGVIAAIGKAQITLKQFKNGMIYAIIVFISQVLLYLTIDILSKYHLSGVVFPLSMGCCIVLFAVYCVAVRHEKLHLLEKVGLGILTLGLFIQAFSSIV